MSVEKSLDEAQKDVRNAKEVVRKKDAKADEIAAALKRLREIRDDKRTNRSELDKVEDAEQRERIADKIEEVEAQINRLVERLDAVEDKSKEAKEELEKHRDRANALRKRRKQIKDSQDRPSPNFAWAEFDCNDGTPHPENSRPAIKDWCEKIGEPVRAKYGPVHINSAFRHASYNARIGGESNSVHIYDYPGRDGKAVAVDFTCANGSAADWFNFTAGKADGRGKYSSFHHADNRNRIGWSDAVWYG